MRRALLAVGGWLLAAAVATAAGLLAVSLLGTGITAGQAEPLSQHQAAAALARADTPRRADPAPPAPTPNRGPGRAVTRALSSPGGNVIARCTGATVYLVSWTTKQGFETDDHVQGPARSAYLKLDSENLDVHMTVTCEGGTPVATTATQPDD